jgi:hypothetical protein
MHAMQTVVDGSAVYTDPSQAAAVTVVGGRSVRRQPQALCLRRVGMRDPLFLLVLPISCADVDAHD